MITYEKFFNFTKSKHLRLVDVLPGDKVDLVHKRSGSKGFLHFPNTEVISKSPMAICLEVKDYGCITKKKWFVTTVYTSRWVMFK